jgi:hypothetical protein
LINAETDTTTTDEDIAGDNIAYGKAGPSKALEDALRFIF